MAKFILANVLRHKTAENRTATNALWLLDLAVIASVIGAFRLLPLPWASAAGARLGRGLGRVLKNRTRHVRANLGLALPDRSAEEIADLAGEVWANAGAVLAEFPHLARFRDPQGDRVEIAMDEQVLACRDAGQQMIFVAAHIANWEVVAATITRLGIPNCAMYAPLSNPWLDRRLRDYRRALGCGLISRDAGLRGFFKAFESGHSLSILTDRRIEGGKEIPFFGETKATSTLPARLALRLGAPLVPVQAQRLPGARFRVSFHAPLRPGDPAAGQGDQAIDLTRQINGKFEEWIADRPGEWVCTSKIWSSSVFRARKALHDGQGNTAGILEKHDV
ncbi:lysophospholipid acyltransferase family protein [Roseovarius ramblicola]|uniref:Lysophospholipid acyltransferase family protein n=1 Tax=Roseovarius ramblicola TaxID=2022336 RepID=A0ABV5I0R3_9RHOB